MTKQEFTQRTNIELTDAQYERVESMYMNAGELDKDAFCQDYKEHKDSVILEALSNHTENLSVKVSELSLKIQRMAIFMIDNSEKYSSIELRNMAIEILGFEKYLSVKLKKGYSLWEVDRNDLITILSMK